jgi:hypothetical protein
LQEDGALGQFPIRKALGVTGREEHFDFRLEFDDLVMEIGPAKPRRSPDTESRSQLCE